MKVKSIIDGAVVEQEVEVNNAEMYSGEIAELEKKLADTDYKAIKFAEGWISAEDYAEVKANRQAWRDRINELQALL